MKHLFLSSAAALLPFAAVVLAHAAQEKSAPPVVVMETNMGTMEITLNPDKAPITCRNFLAYVKEGFYDSTIFHRVISGFMIQGGGLTLNMAEKAKKAPIKNEAANGLSNKRGTISMARLPTGVDTASCQFFINHVDNAFLDHKNDTLQGFGYAVFGAVTKGLDVVDKIASIPTRSGDVPTKPVVILSVRVKEAGE